MFQIHMKALKCNECDVSFKDIKSHEAIHKENVNHKEVKASHLFTMKQMRYIASEAVIKLQCKD